MNSNNLTFNFKLSVVFFIVFFTTTALCFTNDTEFDSNDKFAIQTRQVRQRQTLCIAYYTKVPYAIWKHACGMQSSVKRDDPMDSNPEKTNVSLISRLLRSKEEKRSRSLTAEQLNLILEQIRAQHSPNSPLYII